MGWRQEKGARLVRGKRRGGAPVALFGAGQARAESRCLVIKDAYKPKESIKH